MADNLPFLNPRFILVWALLQDHFEIKEKAKKHKKRKIMTREVKRQKKNTSENVWRPFSYQILFWSGWLNHMK